MFFFSFALANGLDDQSNRRTYLYTRVYFAPEPIVSVRHPLGRLSLTVEGHCARAAVASDPVAENSRARWHAKNKMLCGGAEFMVAPTFLGTWSVRCLVCLFVMLANFLRNVRAFCEQIKQTTHAKGASGNSPIPELTIAVFW